MAVPGEVKCMHEAHKLFGALDWSDLFQARFPQARYRSFSGLFGTVCVGPMRPVTETDRFWGVFDDRTNVGRDDLGEPF